MHVLASNDLIMVRQNMRLFKQRKVQLLESPTKQPLKLLVSQSDQKALQLILPHEVSEAPAHFA